MRPSDIREKIVEAVQERRTFTARTLYLEMEGVQYEDVVHAVRQRFVNGLMPGYNRKLVNLGIEWSDGSPVQGFEYYYEGADHVDD